MRKPRDFDAELKALNDKARQLKERKVHQLGELVIATGADALSIEQLAGILLAAKEKSKDPSAKESWRRRGADFFQGRTNNTGDDTRRDTGGAAQNEGGTPPAGSQSRTN